MWNLDYGIKLPTASKRNRNFLVPFDFPTKTHKSYYFIDIMVQTTLASQCDIVQRHIFDVLSYYSLDKFSVSDGIYLFIFI